MALGEWGFSVFLTLGSSRRTVEVSSERQTGDSQVLSPGAGVSGGAKAEEGLPSARLRPPRLSETPPRAGGAEALVSDCGSALFPLPGRESAGACELTGLGPDKPGDTAPCRGGPWRPAVRGCSGAAARDCGRGLASPRGVASTERRPVSDSLLGVSLGRGVGGCLAGVSRAGETEKRGGPAAADQSRGGGLRLGFGVLPGAEPGVTLLLPAAGTARDAGVPADGIPAEEHWQSGQTSQREDGEGVCVFGDVLYP